LGSLGPHQGTTTNPGKIASLTRDMVPV
jgi:hypothetical protein